MKRNELSKRLKTTDGFIWMLCLDEKSKKDDIFGYGLSEKSFGINELKNHIYKALECASDIDATHNQISRIITKTLMEHEIREAKLDNDFLEKAVNDVIEQKKRMAA